MRRLSTSQPAISGRRISSVIASGFISRAICNPLSPRAATTALKSFDFPTLVMVGEQDAITPPALAEAMIRELKRGSLEVIPSAGHLSNLEAPEAFNFAVRNWLTTITALES